MKRSLIIGIAVVALATTAIAQRPGPASAFTTNVMPMMITSNTAVAVHSVVTDVTRTPLASRKCYFALGTSVVRDRRLGALVNPLILYSVQNFQALRGNAAGARTGFRVGRLPPRIGLTLYFQSFAVIQTGRTQSILASDIARAVVRT